MTVVTSERWTPSQRRAIEAHGRTLVVAAAGSGKTSVLVERVVRALVSGSVAASELLAVTFTDKAAQEMRRRVADSLVAAGRLDLVGELEFAAIGTIHSMCTRILRRHGAAVGVDPGFAVLDEAQANWISDEAARHAIRVNERNSAVHELRSHSSDDDIVAMLIELDRVDANRPLGVEFALRGSEASRLDHPDEVPGAAARSQRAAYERLYTSYARERDRRRRELGRLGFDDLERLAARALERADVRTAVRATWTSVLVDEFQDTNELQFALIDAIAGERLFAVGDEWQSIYRFRGADIEVFRRVRHTDGIDVVPMRDNFRSAAPILDVVNDLFGADEVFGDAYDPVDVGGDAQRVAAPRVELLVVPSKDVPGLPSVVDGPGPARTREAARIAERIRELVEEGVPARDIAVLYPSHAAGAVYEAALTERGLPTVRGAGDGYFDHPDVRDVLAMLRVVRNRFDERGVVELLAGPLGQLEWDELAALVDAAAASEELLWSHVVASANPSVVRCRAAVEHVEQLASTGTFVDAVAAACTLPSIELAVAQQTNARARLANLRRLVELAELAGGVGVADVSGFLEFVAAQRLHARVGEAAIADEDVDAVRLLTVHASKGLEFQHVFVVDLAAPRRSSPPTTKRDAEHELVMPVLHQGKRVAGPVLEALLETDAQLERAEALRRWYVALTRAEHSLYLSGSYDFRRKKPTRKDAEGAPRARGGALKWLLPCVGLEDGEPLEPGTVTALLHGSVVLDTRPATSEHTASERSEESSEVLARLVPPRHEATTSSTPEVLDAEARGRLAARLAARVAELGSDDWRTMHGTRLHDAVARELSTVVAAGEPLQWPEAVRARLDQLGESQVWKRLVELRARAEVPFVTGHRVPDAERLANPGKVASSTFGAGRIDALTTLADGSWWVVDWKSTLAEDDDVAEAWRRHGAQLRRYAQAARAAGAPSCVVTLVSLRDPQRPVTWRIDAQPVADDADEPPRAELP